MTPLSKLRSIMALLITFNGPKGKLEPIARQIDILGSMIEKDSLCYEELVKARNIILDPDKIEEVLEHLANAESYLIYGE